MKPAEQVVLTVGAAHGLGAAVAARCGSSGATVVVADADAEATERVAESIRDRGGRAEAVSVDVSAATDVARAVAAGRSLGALRALVLASHGEERGTLVDCTDDEWRRALATDLKGPFLWMRAAVPAMREAGGGSIVVLGSAALRAPHHGSIAIATAAGALANLCKQVAAEHAVDRVRVNVVAPSRVQMDALDPVCDVVAFLLSDESRALTGAVIPVDARSASV
jgi:NAD(P)-dependent dehydrogenase (short-subunit alcohol dehydrogenase family)